MRAFQGEIRLRLVVENGGLPLFRGVANVTLLRLARFDELPGVNVGVASRTRRRRGFESGFSELAAGLFGLVTFFALHFCVSADQREGSFGMIEAWQVGPGLHIVARFASLYRAVRSSLGHLLIEFPVVRIFVAANAGSIVEMERRNVRVSFFADPCVTFRARHREMRSRKRIAALLMIRDCVGGRVESFHCVALLTLVVVGSRCELAGVRVMMTI